MPGRQVRRGRSCPRRALTIAVLSALVPILGPISIAAAPDPTVGGPAPAAGGPAATGSPVEESPSVYCPVCGARNPSGSRFCLKDGTAIPTLEPSRHRPGFVRAAGTFSPDEIREAMRKAAQSVVRIQVRATSTRKYPVTYWKDEVAEYRHAAQLGKIETSDRDERAAGSGFVISTSGEIVTNAHVASPDNLKAELTVETGDGKSFPARILGVDVASDLALLKIETDSIPPLLWGDSSALRAGQETWAIGNPLDIGISITRGTISGITGARIGLNQVENFLHSDAHITHGNSGGPLVDVFAHVMGVTDAGFFEEKGQGYTIPSRMAQLVVERLRKGGRYERGFVGLQVRPIDSDSISKFGLKRTDGSVVESVLKGTPAERAGLAPGDVLYGINGHLAPNSYLLQEAVSSVGPGAAVRLMIDRRGQVQEIPVTTSARPDAPRIDPVIDMESYLRIWFEEDTVKKQVIIRDKYRSHRAPGLYEGTRVKSVLPAQDWPEEPITLNYYRTRARPVEIDSLQDLRSALQRAYVGGRMAATFEIDYSTQPIASVAFDELWQIIF
jgi:serine protease Do